jgi:lysophospholipid acyltransferase (LPLAT)-like uncharacterized protein
VARKGEPRGASAGVRWLLGLVLGLVASAWLRTLRVRVEADPALEAASDRPWVLAFFHGTQWPLLAWRRRRRTVVLVSLSLDGTLQARALRVLGFSVVRGSSTRGGLRGLASVVRRLRSETLDAAFAVDGPRGPYGVAKGGAALAARASGAVVVPMGSSFQRGLVLGRAWDRFGIAWPFTRVAIRLGPPMGASEASLTDALSLAIVDANAHAARALSTRLRCDGLQAGSDDPPTHPAGATEVSK